MGNVASARTSQASRDATVTVFCRESYHKRGRISGVEDDGGAYGDE